MSSDHRDQDSGLVNARSPLFQRRVTDNNLPQANINQQGYSHYNNTPNHIPQHQSHVQFISSTPLPNPRKLFSDSSRSKRVYQSVVGAASLASPYGAINTNQHVNYGVGGVNSVSGGRMGGSGGAGFGQNGNYQSMQSPLTPKQKQVPLRTTKVSQKLVMLPEEADEEGFEDPYSTEYQDVMLDPFGDPDRRRRGVHTMRTQSELLTKEQRNELGLARVVAYCTAEGYDHKKLIPYLRSSHGVQPRLYDEALYAAYHFPLIPGVASKLMSAPPVRSPGGGSVLDKQLEQYEDAVSDYDEDREGLTTRLRRAGAGSSHSLALHNNDDIDLLSASEDLGQSSSNRGSKKLKNRRRNRSSSNTRQDLDMIDAIGGGGGGGLNGTSHEEGSGKDLGHGRHLEIPGDEGAHIMTDSPGTTGIAAGGPVTPNEVSVPPFDGGEVFFFDYGVTVFWNMSVDQESWILEDLRQFESKKLSEDDVQTEEFHFEYAGFVTPRIYNDMITLRTGNHMIKLTISHAISQSVKLALYEFQMDDTIDDTKIIPMQLAQTGKLNYSRPQITKISGHLFQLRMNVDLVSNVLDSPEIFWSEPELQPLYDAIRGYLEIGQRAKVLRDRCLVISDLLTMLRDDLASNNMNYITLIIIGLIIIAVIVATGEIVVKYLSHRKDY